MRRTFTFIELLIVVIIAGILIGVSIPRLRSSFDKFELESFVKDIYYLGQYLRERSSLENKLYCLSLSDDQGLKIQALYKNDIGEWKKIEGRFGKIYEAPRGITISSIEPAEKTDIYFYPDGSIDNVTISFQNAGGGKISLVIKGSSGILKIK